MGFLDGNKLLSDFQFGFRPKFSTELAATLFLDKIRRQVDEGYMVGAAFIDLNKAFDTVGHFKLSAKLCSYGSNGTELEWFIKYLFNQKVHLSFNGSISNSQKVGCHRGQS